MAADFDDALLELDDDSVEPIPEGPPLPWDWDKMAREAQKHAVEVIHSRWKEGTAGELGMSCIGTGKTVVAYTALLTSPIPWRRALVIAPPEVARSTWPEEPERWKHLRDKFVVRSTVGLTPKKREKIMNDYSFNVVTMSCDSVKWFCELYKPKEIPFDVLVIDEADKFKSRSSQRYKFLSRRVFEFKLRLLQTGSPADEHLLELFTQGHLTQPGIWKGMSWSQFQSKLFYPENMFAKRSKLLPHPGTEKFIFDTLEPITYRVAREDMGDMPERTVLVDRVSFGDDKRGKELRKIYKQMEDDFLFEVNEDEQIPIGHAGALHMKLKQFCDGFVYGEIDENGVRPVYEQHKIKVNRAKDIIEQVTAEGKQILVVYRFRGTAKSLGIPGLDGSTPQGQRAKLIRQFQAGDLPALGLHPASAGHGLNLQLGGCHHMLLFGINESRRLYNQVTGRIDRKGQRRRVVEIRLVVEGTVDVDVYRAIEMKGIGAKTVLDAMRERVGWKND